MGSRPRSEITFEGGLSAPFHRWFRLTPSFSPVLVESWLEERNAMISESGVVLDPFSGAGTTCLVAASGGRDSVGFEINPLLSFVASTSTAWELESDLLAKTAEKVIGSATQLIGELPADAEQAATILGEGLPPIHNIHRWWRDDVIRQLIVIRHQIDVGGGAARDHLRLALASIVYATANITLGRLQLYFVKRDNDHIDVQSLFREAVEKMVTDLKHHKPSKPGSVIIHQSDSRDLSRLEEQSIDGVFTSPPYPNRYSYVWNTRPHLYLLQLITTAKEAGDLDVEAIGGTWGRATSILQKGVVEPSPAVKEAAGDVILRVFDQSNLMGNYLTKYFNDLDTHLANLYPKLKPGAPVGYVVGNTETKGTMVEVHDILASLMASNGLCEIQQDTLRSRNSGVGLTEVTVSARRPK